MELRGGFRHKHYGAHGYGQEKPTASWGSRLRWAALLMLWTFIICFGYYLGGIWRRTGARVDLSLFPSQPKSEYAQQASQVGQVKLIEHAVVNSQKQQDQPQQTQPEAASSEDSPKGEEASEQQPQEQAKDPDPPPPPPPPPQIDYGAACKTLKPIDFKRDDAALNALRAYFEDVLLVVYVKWERESVMECIVMLLRRIYGPVFKQGVMVSTQAVPSLKIHSGSRSAESEDFHYGVWEIFADPSPVPQAPPNVTGILASVAGVLWVDADVVLNYWKLAGFDKSKIWLPTSYIAGKTLGWKLIMEPDPDTEPDDEGVDTQLYYLGQLFYKSLPEFARPNHKAMLDYFAGGSAASDNILPSGNVPLAYIPKAVVGNLVTVVSALREKAIKGDYASPLAFMDVTKPADMDGALASFSKFEKGAEKVAEEYNPDYVGFAPWDYADVPSAGKILRLMGKGDARLLALADEWDGLKFEGAEGQAAAAHAKPAAAA